MDVADPKTFDDGSFADAIIRACREYGAKHPGIDWPDLMNIHDLATSREQLNERLANPEAFVEAFKRRDIPGHTHLRGRSK